MASGNTKREVKIAKIYQKLQKFIKIIEILFFKSVLLSLHK
jgi:ssDNA-specific exonuclease RecJ